MDLFKSKEPKSQRFRQWRFQIKHLLWQS